VHIAGALQGTHAAPFEPHAVAWLPATHVDELGTPATGLQQPPLHAVYGVKFGSAHVVPH
jgi:hypothetical protein